MKTHIIIKAIGWAQSYGTNWCYRYYDITIISNEQALLPLQGIYIDTFGSVTNSFSSLRDIEGLDVIIDNHLGECEQSIRRMNKMSKGTKLDAIIAILNK